MSNQADAVHKPAITVWVSSAYQPPEHCPGAQKAVGYYRRAYTASRTAMGLSGAPQRAWYRCDAARRRAVEWRDRAWQAKRELARWTRDQYAWQTWLPAKWVRVARCETGVNWSHDSGTYVSAFGIYRPGYADDAHRVGNLSWDETVRARGTVPTPREQFEAALSHYRAHGGFSGWGCRGA